MRTVRRLLYRDIVSSVAFVAAAFLSLFFFIDFVEELTDVSPGRYTVLHAALYSLLSLPRHLYELMPIAVLIGAIYALARLAQSSEYTILRTGGLGPGRALALLAWLGLAFGVATYVVGDHLAPLAEREATQVRAAASGSGVRVGRSGAWLRDHADTPEGPRSYAINVGTAGSGGRLNDVRIFAFDGDGRLVQRIAAARAEVLGNDTWELRDVDVTRWEASAGTAQATQARYARYAWPSTLSASVVAAAVLPVSNMSTLELFRYVSHLDINEQTAQAHEIQFWKRALYPFACLVMMGLALPFAYLHGRAGGVSLKVFGGIMLGIGFVLLNSVAGHLGMLRSWTPWIVAAAPSTLFLLLSLAAFSWLVKYR
jgi:lipopolysaccharide export system permease protein